LIEGKSFRRNKADFKKVYGIRSALVHGSLSPNDHKVINSVGTACDYSENSIRRALYNWPASKLRDEKFKVDELDQFFRELVVWVKAERG
jgi:hypothetical protein